jgi:hypothetical protein
MGSRAFRGEGLPFRDAFDEGRGTASTDVSLDDLCQQVDRHPAYRQRRGQDPSTKGESDDGGHRDGYRGPILIEHPEEWTKTAGQTVDRLEDRDLPPVDTAFGEEGARNQHRCAYHHENDVEPPALYAPRHRRRLFRNRPRRVIPAALHPSKARYVSPHGQEPTLA